MIYISIDQRSLDEALQVSIGVQDKDGGGHGFRIAGPKYDGAGKTLLKKKLTKRDAEEIISYLKQVERAGAEHENARQAGRRTAQGSGNVGGTCR